MRQLKIEKQVTNRDITSLDKYLQEIGKVELLTVEEEIALARKIRNGDQEALEKLTKSNLRFVVSVAKQYQNHGLSLPDLINEGNLGLIKAAQRFDETRGFKFISYAVWWIRQSIMQAIAEQSRIVRLPLNKVGSLGKIKKAYTRLEQQYEREPNIEEIAELLDLDANDILDSIKTSGKHLSMDAPLGEDNSNNLYDVLPTINEEHPDSQLTLESLRTEINRVLATLPERDGDVIKMFYGLDNHSPLTLDEIAKKLSLTRERVRQIRDKALRKMKQNTKSSVLKTYLG